MKKFFGVLLFFMGMMSSCNSDEYSVDNLFPNEYHKILYIKNDGIRSLRYNTAATEAKDSILIIKAGSNPALTAQGRLDVMSQEEIKLTYADKPYVAISSACYKFENDPNITFLENETAKYFTISFDVNAIHQFIEANPDNVYVLALKLVSEHEDIVNVEKNQVLFIFDIRNQQVEWSIDKLTTKEIVYKSLDVKLTAEVDNNVSDFTCELDNTENVQLVADYNAEYGTDYELLPEEAYSATNFNFQNGIDQASAILTVNRTGMEADKDYLLPLKFARPTDSGIEVSNEIHYLAIKAPYFSGVEIDRSNWKILFCNSDNKMSGVDWDNAGATAILDDDVTSYWASSLRGDWADDWQYQHARGDDYCYDFTDYHAFAAMRQPISIVIDMQESVNIYGIGLIQRQDVQYADFKTADFYISDDDEFIFHSLEDGGTLSDYTDVALNNWNLLFTWSDVPQQKEISWRTLNKEDAQNKVLKGRYLKIVIRETYRTTEVKGKSCLVANLSEIKAKRLLTINGEEI